MEQVSFDLATPEPGVDSVDRIRAAVAEANALVVVIGRGWMNARNIHGGLRLDDPADEVRVEVGLALSGYLVVVPVLVDGATMPAGDELPADLARLARLNALTLTDPDWGSGMDALVATLRRIRTEVVPFEGRVSEAPEIKRSRWRYWRRDRTLEGYSPPGPPPSGREDE